MEPSRTRYCKTSLKVRYRDELAAKLALASLHREDNPEHTERTCYQCEWCGGWHLTSRAGRNWSGYIGLDKYPDEREEGGD